MTETVVGKSVRAQGGEGGHGKTLQEEGGHQGVVQQYSGDWRYRKDVIVTFFNNYLFRVLFKQQGNNEVFGQT